MPRLIDTHCHLAHGRLRSQAAAVLQRAEFAGVVACICAAGDLNESESGLSLARQFTRVYFTAGVHPHEAKNAAEGYAARIEELAADAKCVALGEMGLDYHYDFSPRPIQQRVFAEQLQLAVRLAKPVVIHTREAFDDTLAILKDSGLDGRRVVFHSFTEGPQEARAVLEIGAMIAFSGIVTFKNADILRQAAILVPDGRIMVETDAPYLSPEPVRKMKTNEPANVAHVSALLARLRGTAPEAFAELTTTNAAGFFGLDIAAP
jgi:TatD DNase family protein